MYYISTTRLLIETACLKCCQMVALLHHFDLKSVLKKITVFKLKARLHIRPRVRFSCPVLFWQSCFLVCN